MILISKRIKASAKVIILLVILSSNVLLLTVTTRNNSIPNTSTNMMNNENPRASYSQSYSRDWLENTDFNSGIEPWKNKTIGDKRDLEADYSGDAANYKLLGNSGTYSLILDPSNQTEMDKWTAYRTSQYKVLPDIYYKDPGVGFYASHYWDEYGTGEQDNNTAGVYWRRTVTMPVNMSDYEIISASVEAEFNARVQIGTRTGGGIEVLGDTTSTGQDDIWDYAYFYTEIASMWKPDIRYLLAKNNTGMLGAGDGTGYDSYPDTPMTNIVGEDLLETLLETVLSDDYFNFYVFLGIDIFCADNDIGYDEDNFADLYIRSLNLTFAYEKRIDLDTSLSWYQIGDMINHTGEAYYTNVKIDDVSFNFEYSINQSWPSVADDCRFEIDVNDRTQTTYPDIKLISYNYSTHGGSFIEARSGGYKLTNLVQSEENISLSIRIIMAEEFTYDKNINVSIDNIYFTVSYTVFYNPPPPQTPADDDDDTKTETSIIEEPWFNLLIAIAAIAGATCLTGYIVYYIRVLKYPKPVRKVRKYRRTLKKKKSPDIPILGRNIAFDELYKGKLETIGSEVKRKSLKPITIGEKSVEKLPKKITPDKVDKLIGKTKK
ncbi:MAG: hypothetical protein ACFFAH_08470 [Promethearchaeota archaeon]